MNNNANTATKKMPNVRSEWVDVTPKKAQELLQKNKTNRPLSPRAVADIVDRMRAGTWIVTHQGIGFDYNGCLVDGQHRLTAIVRSGITHRYLLTYDLEPEAFDHIDVGGKGPRTAADLLARRVPAITNRSAVCAAVSMALRGLRSAKTPDKVVVVDFVERFHQIITPLVGELRPIRLVSAPVIGAFVAAVRPLDEPGNFPGPKGGRPVDDVLLVAMRFRAMEWRSHGDPMKTLFERLLREKEEEDKLVEQTKLYSLTVASIRAELLGRTLTKAQGTEIDWGEPGDQVKAGSEAHRIKQSHAQKKAWRATPSVVRRAASQTTDEE